VQRQLGCRADHLDLAIETEEQLRAADTVETDISMQIAVEIGLFATAPIDQRQSRRETKRQSGLALLATQ
jgi:hypothetical protein